MPATHSRSHAASHTASRAVNAPRSEVLDGLREDHKRVKKAYKRFEKLDPHKDKDAEECQQIVQQVLDELTLHAALEEEYLYPAARGVVEDDLLDEAEVEHESMHQAIDQLRSMSPDEEKYYARFTVLCEYVMHHVKEEEGEMFPKLDRSRQLDWEAVSEQMRARRAEGEAAAAPDGDRDLGAMRASLGAGGRKPAARAQAARAADSGADAADEARARDPETDIEAIAPDQDEAPPESERRAERDTHRGAPGQRR